MSPSSPLSIPAFRRLFAAQLLSLLGTGLTTVGLALLAWELAGSDAGLILGLALGIKMVAYLAVAPVVGALVARLPRKRWLVGLDMARAGLLLIFPLIDSSWQLFALILLLNICAAGFTPVYQALLPDVVQSEQAYTRALSLSRLAVELENLISPTLAALLLLFMPFSLLFQLNTAALLCSALLVASATIPGAVPSDHTAGLLHNIGFGMRAYLATPRLRALLGLHMLVAAGGSMVFVNTIVYVREVLGLGEHWIGYAMAALGSGAIIAAVATPRLLARNEDRKLMLGGGFVMVIALLLGLTNPGLAGLLAIWMLIGLATSLVLTPAGRVLRRSCRDNDRTDFFAANFALSHGLWLIAYPLAGALGAWSSQVGGLPLAFGGLAALACLSLLMAWRSWPAREEIVLWHEHPEVTHEHTHVHDDHHRHEHEGWEGPEPHQHPHVHAALRHRHLYVIDEHHPLWP